MASEPAPGEALSAYMALANGARWLETRMGLDPASARFAARQLMGILIPYVKVDVFADMADRMRDAGLTAEADAIDAVRHTYVTELTRPKDDHDGDDGRTGGSAS